MAGKLGWTVEDVMNKHTMYRRMNEHEREEQIFEGFGLDDDAKAESYGSWSAPDKADQEDPMTYLNEDAEPPNRGGRGVIVAVDLLPIFPIPGVKTLQTNFLSPEADAYIEALLPTPTEGRLIPTPRTVDVVLSDMAANFSGNRTADIESSLQICEAVLQFTKRHLKTGRDIGRRKGGVLVCVIQFAYHYVPTADNNNRLKHFEHPLLQKFRKEELEPRFTTVMYHKPPSSRGESSEGYWVCLGWNGDQKN